jgi:hypothetical protein
MRPNSIIRATAYAVSGVWSVAAALAGWQFDDTSKRLLGFIPLALVVLFTVWDRWAWRWKPFINLSSVPDLNGTWLGEYEAEWVDDNDIRGKKASPALLYVSQKFTTLSITLVTEESKSYSTLSHVTRLDSGEFRVNYEYANTPLSRHRQTLPTHLGSAELTVASARGAELVGEYWTNRMSRGALSFQWRSVRRANTVDAARQLPDEVSARDV